MIKFDKVLNYAIDNVSVAFPNNNNNNNGNFIQYFLH